MYACAYDLCTYVCVNMRVYAYVCIYIALYIVRYIINLRATELLSASNGCIDVITVYYLSKRVFKLHLRISLFIQFRKVVFVLTLFEEHRFHCKKYAVEV